MQRVVKLGRNTDGMPFGGFLDWDREGFGSRIHGMTTIHSDSDYVINLFFKSDACVRTAESVVEWVEATFRLMMLGLSLLGVKDCCRGSAHTMIVTRRNFLGDIYEDYHFRLRIKGRDSGPYGPIFHVAAAKWTLGQAARIGRLHGTDVAPLVSQCLQRLQDAGLVHKKGSTITTIKSCHAVFLLLHVLSQVPILPPSNQVEHALQLAAKFIRSKQVLLLTDDGFATMHGVPCMAFPTAVLTIGDKRAQSNHAFPSYANMCSQARGTPENFAKQLETCAEEIWV